MRTPLIATILLCPLLTAHASSVLWNAFVGNNYDISRGAYGDADLNWYDMSLSQSYYCTATAAYNYILNKAGNRIIGLAPSERIPAIVSDFVFIEMIAGDIVNDAAFQSDDKLFLRSGITAELGKSISAFTGDTIYLGVKTYGHNPSGADGYMYGWIELFVDTDNITLGRSAIGIEFQSLEVGRDYSADAWSATPEPTTSILTLTGLCLLALRRKPSNRL